MFFRRDDPSEFTAVRISSMVRTKSTVHVCMALRGQPCLTPERIGTGSLDSGDARIVVMHRCVLEVREIGVRNTGVLQSGLNGIIGDAADGVTDVEPGDVQRFLLNFCV